MSRSTRFACLGKAATALSLLIVLVGPARATTDAQPQSWRTALEVPLHFEPNRGQAAEDAQFLARGQGYSIAILSDGAALRLRSDEGAVSNLQMRLVGAEPTARHEPQQPLPGRSHYLRGRAHEAWLTDVRHYRAVRHRNVYPGIDLIYYGDQRRLQYDFVVAPGADPSAIRLRFDGAQAIRLDAEGRLVLATPGGKLVQTAPFVYQERDGRRVAVAGSFVLDEHDQVGFVVAAYDPQAPLIIDPVLQYASYLGGSGSDSGQAIAVDAAGNIFVSGTTTSLDFPLVAPLQSMHAGPLDANDIFISKFDPTGSVLLFSTYLGGSGDDRAQRMLLDNAGNPVLVGYTESSDFPVLNAAQPVFAGGSVPGLNPMDGFLLKLSNAGALLFSTYIGGDDQNFPLEFARGLYIDAANGIHVSGDTGAPNFPVTHLLPGLPCSGDGTEDSDLWVAKYLADGTRVFATCFGGSQRDAGRGVALDGAGNIFVGGWTRSPDMPATVGTAQAVYGGLIDGFIARLNPTATALDFVTYVGGSDQELIESLVVDSGGNPIVSGSSLSVDFPVTPGAFQTTFGGSDGTFNYGDAVVAKLSNDGSSFASATYYGGTGDEIAWIMQRGAGDKIVIAGNSSSVDLPVVAPVQATNAGSSDAFVAVLDATLSGSEFGSYFGGSGNEFVSWGLAPDPSGAFYLSGYTESVDLPLASPYQGAIAGSSDAFVVKLAADPAPQADLAVTKLGLPLLSRRGRPITYTIGASNLSAGEAIGVIVTDRLPAFFTFESVTTTQGSCVHDGHRSVTCDLGTLSSGGFVIITIVGRSSRPAVLANLVEIGGDQPDPVLINNHHLAINLVIP